MRKKIKLVRNWVKEAVRIFGLDLEGCWCPYADKIAKKEIKKALEKILKIRVKLENY